MIGGEVEYKYLSENVPQKKINYSYSTYYGRPFITAWIASRSKYLDSDVIKEEELTSSSILGKTLMSWQKEMNRDFNFSDLNLLVKRFEVTKKIYSEYDNLFRPVGSKDFSDIVNYLLFANTLICAYRQTKLMPYLNALIKVNDICCSMIKESTHKGYLQNNLLYERNFIFELMSKLEIE